MKDAFEEALDAARDALETALEYAEEARDAAQEADAAAASASEASARARDAGAAGYAAVNTADAAAQTAFGEWLSAYYFESGSGKAEVFYAVSAATEARDTALEAASRADRDHALGQVSKAYQEMISAAGLVADANSRASAEPSDNPAAAAESMQGMAAKAAEAAGAANSALSKARDALQGAEEAATAAQRALGSANTALQRAKEAQEALEQAQEGLSGTLASVYAVAVSAFETAAESVSDAADVSEDAADAALAAKRAAGYMVTGPRYSFGRIPPDDIEKWAFHTAYAADFLEMTLHGFSEEDGDFLSNLLLVLTTGTDAIFKLAADRPSWAVWPARLLSPMLGSFPYMHTEASAGNGMIFWLTYYGARGVEAHMYNFIAQNARDMLLSLLTLLNHDRSAEGSLPENFYMAEGVVQFLTWPFIFAWAAATPQEDYNVRNGRLWGIDWAVGGLVFTLLTSSLGALGALALAGYYKFWEAPGAAWEMWAHQLWKCAILSWVGYWPALFMIHENETDDGNYNPTGVTYVNGYPPRDSSPYLLPFEGGPVQCAQGNQGIWSHNNDTNQIYAYDFALDQGTEILASRSGTVVDWFDFAQDDENEVTTLAAADPNFLANRTNSDNWNFVTIRHDYDPANPANYPTVPDPGHDPVDAGGNGVYTYAVYGHGRNGSVREAFAARNPPVAPANIIGTRVARGEFIMRAGDTGMSAYNHLHMHVKTGPTPAAAGAPPTLDAGTIPFVFQDAQHRDMYHAALDDGIPRSLKFYRSDNTRP